MANSLALASAERLSACGPDRQALDLLIVNVITATTLPVEIIGPIYVKLAIRRAMLEHVAGEWIPAFAGMTGLRQWFSPSDLGGRSQTPEVQG